MDVQADYRAACVQLLSDYKSDAQIDLQIYRARPASISPPTAFVDSMGETIAPIGRATYQRSPTAEIIVLHGEFDSGNAVDQRDAFVDGFVVWVRDRVHAAGSNSLIAVTSVDDEPTYVPDWLLPQYQRTYYGTRITLEGYVGDN